MIPDLNEINIVVVGMGATGQAAAGFLLEQGARVVITDSRCDRDLELQGQALAEKGARLELGGHRQETFRSADLILLSPGVPPTLEPLTAARVRGVPLTGEIELASRFIQTPIVAVTGTNGKTTTTTLLGEIFKAAGRKVFVGGNIGCPLISHIPEASSAELVVLEVSSFQLETAVSFKPYIALLLNLSPDHMDRYPDFAAYAAAKARIFQQQDHNDYAIVSADDPFVQAIDLKGVRLPFSRIKPLSHGAFIRSERLLLYEQGREILDFPCQNLALTGTHNRENIMAALLAAWSAGVAPEVGINAAAAFRGLPHRIELVGEFAGVRYFDDSKATNIGAVIKSLESFTEPVILIAGGRDKDSDFSQLKEIVVKRVKILILLGEARDKINSALKDAVETVLVTDMAEAVNRARESAAFGDVVLLAPACASFDMFDDYAHRGRVFSDLVRKAA